MYGRLIVSSGGNLEDEDNVDELKFLVENQFGFLGISEEEYEFNEEEE